MERVDNLGGAADVGLRVARLRGEQGLTYRELEEATASAGNRVSASTLWRIENGDPPPKISVDDLVTLCRVFDVTPDDILTSAAELEWREVKRLSGEITRAYGECLGAAQRLYMLGEELQTLIARDGERGAQIAEAVQYQWTWPNMAHVHPFVRDAIVDRLRRLRLAGSVNVILEKARSRALASGFQFLPTDLTTVTTVAELEQIVESVDRPKTDGTGS